MLFDVTDGDRQPEAEATVTVKHKPLHTTLNFRLTKIKAEEGQSRRLEIRRTGDTRTEQSIKLKLDGIELSADDLKLPEVVFKQGSNQAFVDLAFNTDGLWEGIEKGKIIVDKVTSQKNVICDWRNNSVELCINDLDSRHDGRGNHQSENDYGIAGAIQQRLADADYADGRHSPGGADREGARVISNSVIDQVTTERNRRQLSDFVWGWGQLIDHDIVATEGVQESMPIPIPADDFFLNDPDIEFCDEDPTSSQPDGTYSDNTARFTAADHFTFTRSRGFTDANGVRQHKNEITSFLDASVVYGSDLETANNLRSFAGGKLKIESNGLLPTSDQREGQGFVAGDHRATENPLLSSLQTLWVREHNRICDQLSAQQPGLSDERLYQKARVKVMGLLQHITYNEFLPAVLGDDALTDYKGYDAEVNPRHFQRICCCGLSLWPQHDFRHRGPAGPRRFGISRWRYHAERCLFQYSGAAAKRHRHGVARGFSAASPGS